MHAKSRAAVAVVTEDGYGVGLADRDIPGYTPTNYTPATYEEAKLIAQGINEASGLTDVEAGDIVLSSLRKV